MRGTGPVSLNGSNVYGYFTTDGAAVRLRLSVDEFDQLGLNEGQRLTIALPGAAPRDLLVVAAARTPPFVWLELRASAVRSAG